MSIPNSPKRMNSATLEMKGLIKLKLKNSRKKFFLS